jgi:hypothetical protein
VHKGKREVGKKGKSKKLSSIKKGKEKWGEKGKR